MTPGRLVPVAVAVALILASGALWAKESSRKTKAKKPKDPIEAKLDAILEAQASIQQQLDELTEALRIVKVRVSR